jgi:glycosyltransferase involved in cell wall biosynthesis
LSNSSPISVLLATEGTYPFARGGVSTWCDRLTHGLPDINFRLLAVVTNPFEQPKYELAFNVQEVIKVPQWGLLQPAEYSDHNPASVVLSHLWSTTPRTVAASFQPLFERFLALILSGDCNNEQLGSVLLELQTYFQLHDYAATMSSMCAWNAFRQAVSATRHLRPAGTENPSFGELKQAYRLLYHLLIVLHFPIPKADVAHSSAASFCGIPCVLTKLVHGTPYLLTEHGVYLREQYLNLRNYIKAFFVRWFLYRLVRTVVELNYYFADQVSPVCAYNARWEEHLGVSPSRIKVIFNGVDPQKFHRYGREPRTRRLVTTVGLIYPLKGQLDLISATDLLRHRYSDIDVRFYGNPSDTKYFDACKRSVSELALERHVTFAGPTTEPWKVYSNADVVAFTSISEAFPYVVVEAMLCGAAIVATDVGGVREALGDSGILVPAKSPQEMADAISFLLDNEDERERLGRLARARALQYFTEERFLDTYRSTYAKLASRRVQDLEPSFNSRRERRFA